MFIGHMHSFHSIGKSKPATIESRENDEEEIIIKKKHHNKQTTLQQID